VTGPQLLVWGFCVSTVALWHSTFAVNSLGHRFGRRRFETRDASRNLWWLALLTMGEGWHNNHHRFPASARHGLARHELDPSWWLIRALAALGLARDVRIAPGPWSGAPIAGPPELSASAGPGRR
jgi:stearoyl-CoA desaturase (delta-9 desaturase)